MVNVGRGWCLSSSCASPFVIAADCSCNVVVGVDILVTKDEQCLGGTNQ